MLFLQKILVKKELDKTLTKEEKQILNEFMWNHNIKEVFKNHFVHYEL